MAFGSPLGNVRTVGFGDLFPSSGWGGAINDGQVELWKLADDYEDVTTGYTLTNITIGNGTVGIVRRRVISLCHVVVSIKLGSTSSITGTVDIRDITDDPTAQGSPELSFRACYYDASAADWHMGSTTVNLSSDIIYPNVSGGAALINATTPFTWATDDIILISGYMAQGNETQVLR